MFFLLQGLFQRVLFDRAFRQQQHLFGLHDGADAHGDGLGGNLIYRCKETLVCFDGTFFQRDHMSLFNKSVSRLVEGNMAVVADAQKLQVDASVLRDRLVIGPGEGTGILRASLRHVAAPGADVDMAE